MRSVLAKGMVNGKIFAFEPIEENLHLLEQLITDNAFSWFVVVALVALGDTNADQKIFIYHSPLMSFLESAVDGQDTKGRPQRTVNSLTLDKFVFV
jgi:FkbM family methyltransferase